MVYAFQTITLKKQEEKAKLIKKSYLKIPVKVFSDELVKSSGQHKPL